MEKNELTQHEKIFYLMCLQKDRQVWFYPPDFMTNQLGDLFVGYEATARFSELARKLWYIFENKKEGKYMYRRIKWEELDNNINRLPFNYQQILKATGVKPATLF